MLVLIGTADSMDSIGCAAGASTLLVHCSISRVIAHLVKALWLCIMAPPPSLMSLGIQNRNLSTCGNEVICS